jgi:hypothetical protein
MPNVQVSVMIDAPPDAVWAVLEDVAGHVRWMHDAHEIRFLGPQRAGVGTTFACETRVGPLRTTDVMEITEWRPRRAMAVRHSGIVTGTGRFRLRRARGGRTRLAWHERLVFPWRLGGPIGAAVARPVLAAVWRRNLRNLRAIVEAPRGS